MYKKQQNSVDEKLKQLTAWVEGSMNGVSCMHIDRI